MSFCEVFEFKHQNIHPGHVPCFYVATWVIKSNWNQNALMRDGHLALEWAQNVLPDFLFNAKAFYTGMFSAIGPTMQKHIPSTLFIDGCCMALVGIRLPVLASHHGVNGQPLRKASCRLRTGVQSVRSTCDHFLKILMARII